MRAVAQAPAGANDGARLYDLASVGLEFLSVSGSRPSNGLNAELRAGRAKSNPLYPVEANTQARRYASLVRLR